jgi:glutamine amidotransferase
MSIVLVDYGIGNLRSVRKALETVGAQVVQTSEPEVILSGDKVVLPGVGAFKDGMAGLEALGLIPVIDEIVQRKTPLLGICLGMQLFFSSSLEMGDTQGLGYISGTVKEFSEDGLKVPQTGWNQLEINPDSFLLKGVPDQSYVYFNHSYYCEPVDPGVSAAETDYGVPYTSAVEKGSIYGVQFHPEKSQDAGLKILKNFVEVCQ